MRPRSPARLKAACLALLTCSTMAGCAREDSPPKVEAPGAEPTAKTRVLAAGSAVLQNEAPVDALDVYVDGFHFYNHDVSAQMEAHHYCAVVDEDVRQCVIFDGNTRQAKLMGVEYIVSRRIFEQLPEDERKLWHSHAYEVRSGTLVAPGLPQLAEHELMEELVGTYGKTWHTWHTDHGEPLPMGHPMLMAGFTADGQLDPALVATRDQRMGISTPEHRESRADIVAPEILPGADAWERGDVLQLELKKRPAPDTPPEAKAEPDRDAPVSPAAPTRRIRPQRVPQLYAVVPAHDG